MTTQSQLHPQRSKNLPPASREGEDANVNPRPEAGEIHVDGSARSKSSAAPAPLDANEADRFAASFRPSWAPLAEPELAPAVRPMPVEPPAPVNSDSVFNAGNTDEPLTLPGRRMKRRALGLTAASVASFFLLAYWGISSASHDDPHGRASDTNAATHADAPPPRHAPPALPPAAAQPEPVALAKSEPAIAQPGPTEAAPATATATTAEATAPTTQAAPTDLSAQPAPPAAPAELAKTDTAAAERAAQLMAEEAARKAAEDAAAQASAAEAARKLAEDAAAEEARKVAAEAAAIAAEQRRAESARATLEAEKDRAAAAAQPVPAPAPPQLAAAAKPESASASAGEAAKPKNPLLVVRALPDGSKLWLDGQRMANPFDVRLPAGYRHKIEARADGYEPTSQMVRLESDAKLTITLRRAAPTPASTTTQAEGRRRGAGFVAESPY